eukprot:11288275-Prorocentrum_lima.AAC.1
MTSSLVGSEMCIRDRVCGGGGIIRGHVDAGAMRDSGGVNICGTARASRPVSYTHLTLPTICSV